MFPAVNITFAESSCRCRPFIVFGISYNAIPCRSTNANQSLNCGCIQLRWLIEIENNASAGSLADNRDLFGFFEFFAMFDCTEKGDWENCNDEFHANEFYCNLNISIKMENHFLTSIFWIKLITHSVYGYSCTKICYLPIVSRLHCKFSCFFPLLRKLN